MSSRFPATHGRAKRQHDQLTAVDLRWRGVGRIASITSGAAARESGCGRPLSGRFRPFILAAIQPNRAEWRPASVHCPGLAWLESFRLAGGGLLLSKWNGHRPRRLRHGSHSPRTWPLRIHLPPPKSLFSPRFGIATGTGRCAQSRTTRPPAPLPPGKSAGVSWPRSSGVRASCYPRVGFIVTNLVRPAERVVAFYNQRARRNSGSRRARTRSNGRGCPAARLAPTPCAISSMR